jgi:hypothetical protein
MSIIGAESGPGILPVTEESMFRGGAFDKNRSQASGFTSDRLVSLDRHLVLASTCNHLPQACGQAVEFFA